MKHNTRRQCGASRSQTRGRSQTWGALALGLSGWALQPALNAAPAVSRAAAQAQDQAQDQASALAARFEAWRLAVVTSVLTPSLRAELEAIAKEAQSGAAADGASEAARALWAEVQAEQEALAPKAAIAAMHADQGAPEDEVLNRSILVALKAGKATFIKQLGARAVPTLKALASAGDGSPTPEGELDPLDTLFTVDAAAGMDTALELMASNSFLVKRATARAVERRIHVWTLVEPVGETNWAFKNPAWVDVATRAFDEPAVSVEAMTRTLLRLTELGLLPRELAEQATEAECFKRDPGVYPASGLWFLERTLGHPSPEARSTAVRTILKAGVVAPVLPLANDPDPEVRRTLAYYLVRTTVGVYDDRSKVPPGSTTKATYFPFDPPLFEAFKVLATSANEDISEAALRGYYDRLKDPKAPQLSAGQLRELIALATTPLQLSFLAYNALAAPDAEQVPIVKAVIARGAELDFPDDQNSSFQSELSGSIVRSLTVPQAESFWEIAFFAAETLELDSSTVSRTSQAAAQLAGDGEIDALRLVDWLDKYGSLGDWNLTRSGKPYPWLERLSQPERGRAVKAYWKAYEAYGDRSATNQVINVRLDAIVSDAEVQRSLLVDESVMPLGRFWAALGLASARADSIDNSLAEPLADALAQLDDHVKARDLLDLLPTPDLQQKVMRAMVRSPKATDVMLLKLAVDPDDATFDALAERFPIETWKTLGFKNQIWRCVKVLIHRSEDTLHPMLEEICFSDLEYARLTAVTISRTRSPALFPLACRILESSEPGSPEWNAAVDAIAGYFNDEAAAALLEAAKAARTEESRERVMTALRQITEWREAASAWERSTGAEAKRAKAIEELVATLEDSDATPEARAASMRGLGLLGAVGELPRIIAALSSPEEEMKAAARAALERLER